MAQAAGGPRPNGTAVVTMTSVSCGITGVAESFSGIGKDTVVGGRSCRKNIMPQSEHSPSMLRVRWDR